jgi:hypothetical protein
VKLRPASGGGERETSAALQMGATRCRWAQKPGGRPSQTRGGCAVDGSSAAWWRSRFFSPEALELLRLGGWWLVVGGFAWPAVSLSCSPVGLWTSRPAYSRALDWATYV